MKRDKTGHYVLVSTVGEQCNAFVPDPLPPTPPILISPDIQNIIDKAMHALGGLNFAASSVPDINLFLYMYVRKEAVLSSQIEGTQSSLSDLLRYEADGVSGVPLDDVQEVSNYVAAMNHGLRRMKDGFPVSLRLLNEIHGVLLSGGRGSSKTPGEFRRTQNWIGGSRPGNAVFIPPPPEHIMDCMGKLELFLHDKPAVTPVLLKAALAHVQFETIHPYLDGNGRLGRLLMTLLMCSHGVLSEPLLYLSLFFKTHRNEYYNHLQKVRIDGDWEAWIEFFATAVLETASGALDTIKSISTLIGEHRKKIESLNKSSLSILQVHKALIGKPFITIQQAAEAAIVTFPSASAAMSQLEKLGIAREITGKARNRVFAYYDYIELLKVGA